jgi:GNAT superfamily N-acetyltransferase
MISATETPDNLLLANERNIENLYALLAQAPGIDYYESAQMIRIRTGVPHPFVNTVLRLRLNSDDAETVIASTLEYFDSHKLPVSWMLNGSSFPLDLDNRLQHRGIHIVAEMPGMSIDLATLIEPMDLPFGLEIRAITHVDKVGITDWAATSSTGSGIPIEVMEVFLPLFEIYNDGSIAAFTAYLDGKPVGTSLLYLDDECAGIYCVAVLPEARRQGIGAAITTHALRAARDCGYCVGTLQASKMGLPVYERLGFKAHGRFTVHTAKA